MWPPELTLSHINPVTIAPPLLLLTNPGFQFPYDSIVELKNELQKVRQHSLYLLICPRENISRSDALFRTAICLAAECWMPRHHINGNSGLPQKCDPSWVDWSLHVPTSVLLRMCNKVLKYYGGGGT
jgi:hypothetical protein